MKHFILKVYAVVLLFCAGVVLPSCKSQPKDSDIQASVNEKLSADANYAGITASVNEGVVTLNGTASDATTRTNAENAVKEVKGVKSVVDNVTVTPPATTAPVDIATDDALNTGVRDAVKDYPGVKATVSNGEITLTGNIKRDQWQKLRPSLDALSPKKINNNLTIK